MNKFIIAVAMTAAMVAPAAAQEVPFVGSPSYHFGERVAGSGIGFCLSADGQTELATGVTLAQCKGSQEVADGLRAEMERQERIRAEYTREQAEILIAQPEFDPRNGIVTPEEARTIWDSVTPRDDYDTRLGAQRRRQTAEWLATRQRPGVVDFRDGAQERRYQRLLNECRNGPTDARVLVIQKYAEPGVHGSEYATLTQEQYLHVFEECEADGSDR